MATNKNDGPQKTPARAGFQSTTNSQVKQPVVKPIPVTKTENAPLKNETFAEIQKILLEVYKETYLEDPGVELECLRIKLGDQEMLKNNHVVNRRAPLTYLDKSRGITDDPALQNNPLSGRLVMAYCSTAALIMIFIQALCLHKTRNGTFLTPVEDNKMIGPDSDVLYDLGGLNVNAIRNTGQTFRLFWAMWMHSGWVHLALNVFSQLQFLVMFEPDWGTFRCVILFFVSGITGNLISAVSNPCFTTVGSSGALYGLMGAMVIYCMEYWTTIPRPGFMVIFTVIVVLGSLATGFTSFSDNWAHVGGLIGGLCLSLFTVQSFDSLRDMRKSKPRNISHMRPQGIFRIRVTPPGKAKAPKKTLEKKNRKLSFCKRVRDYFSRNYTCRLAETLTRVIASHILIATWVVCFLLIYVAYEYQPTGQITYSGIIACCCCYDASAYNNWVCHPCDYVIEKGPRRSQTWGQYCKLGFSKKKNFGLKNGSKFSSLYDALGLEYKTQSSIVTPEKFMVNRNPDTPERLDHIQEFFQQQKAAQQKTSVPDRFVVGFSGETVLNDLIEFSQVSVDKRTNFTEFFDHELSEEELDWLRNNRLKFQKRTEVVSAIMAEMLAHGN